MVKVGFIDYYLDEWHANNYPAWIAQRLDGKYKVCYAYGVIDSPRPGSKTNRQWADTYGVELLDSMKAVIEKSDVLVVLGPDNPETHEMLTELALKSGKLTYVDKTFAPDKATALRIFANADAHGTKCYSTSALRYSSELQAIDKSSIHKLYTEGPGSYEIYSIHQIEPIVALMDTPAEKVMFIDNGMHPSMVIAFADGRFAQMHQAAGLSFRLTPVDAGNNAKDYVVNSDFFGIFIDNMIEFFETGIVPVPHEQTVQVIAIREAGMKAMKTPFEWVEV
ncbi:MAG: hypothetical protein IKM02_03800 [Clostridia bacterium]|nr:hypothetical protein [Clostridia bacterium]